MEGFEMKKIDFWRDRSMPRSLLDDVWGWMDEIDSTMKVTKNTLSDRAFFAPACDVKETDNDYLLSFDVPGIEKDEIDVELNGSQLTVSGERKSEEDFEHKNTRRAERSFGAFHRSFTIPSGVDAKTIKAHHENGVLKIAIPKKEGKKAKKIQISSGGHGFLKRLATHKSEAKVANS